MQEFPTPEVNFPSLEKYWNMSDFFPPEVICIYMYHQLNFFVCVQVGRAELRLSGARYLLQVLNQDSLLPSVKYSILCGWMGVVKTSSGGQQQQQSMMAKPHYLSGVENIPPTLQTQLELEFQEMEQWVVKKLRASIVEAEQALRQANVAATKQLPCEFILRSFFVF